MEEALAAVVEELGVEPEPGDVQVARAGEVDGLDAVDVGAAPAEAACEAARCVEGVRGFLETIDRSWLLRYAAPREFIDAGDKVVVLGETEGKDRGTGDPFKNRWTHVFTVRDGRIATCREFLCQFAGDATPPPMRWE